MCLLVFIVSLLTWWQQTKQLTVSLPECRKIDTQRPSFCTLTFLNIFGLHVKWDLLESKWHDLKLWKRVSLFRSTNWQRSHRSPCLSLDVEFLFLALELCGIVMRLKVCIHTLRVLSLVPESPQLLSLPTSLLKWKPSVLLDKALTRKSQLLSWQQKRYSFLLQTQQIAIYDLFGFVLGIVSSGRY